MTEQQYSFATRAIRAGEPEPRIEGSLSLPIFQTSTFEYTGAKVYDNIRYARLNNTPNHLALHVKLASLESAEAALVMSSGMAAISTTLLALLSGGDHFLAQGTLYGGTHQFLANHLPPLGVEFDFISAENPTNWEEKLRPNTRLIYTESMTNPTLDVADLDAVVEFARAHELISVIDNTFASPFNFRPAEWGFDLSIHSGTKYLNGHSDVIAGAVIGRGDLIEQILQKLNLLGGTLDTHACFLLHRGLKTLAVRMRQHNASTLKIAQFLENHPAVTNVNYPGLASHPQHKRAERLFDGFSGMLSFSVRGGVTAAVTLMDKLTLPVNAPSLGGVETLITRPATTSHAAVPPEERLRLGIPDSLIRLSVGLEDTQDLIADFERALDSIQL